MKISISQLNRLLNVIDEVAEENVKRIKEPVFTSDNRIIYNNVIRECRLTGIPETKVEEMAKVARGTIGKWRIHSPNISNLGKIADALNVPLSALLMEKKND